MASAPGRASGSVVLRFGLVNVAVKVYAGIEDSAIRRKRFTKDGHPVGMQNFDKETGEIVAYEELSLRYELPDGRLVELSDEEIAAAVGSMNGVADVVAMVPESRLCEYQQEGLLQVRPDGGKAKTKSTPADKPFLLLMAAMKAEKVFGLVRYTLRGKPRMGALTYDGFLRPLVFDDEVRETLPWPEGSTSTEELKMARALVKNIRTDERLPVPDEVTERVREYAEVKAEGETPEVETLHSVQATDLMSQLAASVEATTKGA